MTHIKLIADQDAHLARAAAHARARCDLRAAQRPPVGITDDSLGWLLLGLEMGETVYRNNVVKRWTAARGSMLAVKNIGGIVNEAIRTGLVRHWVDRAGMDRVIAAPVHGMGADKQSVCHFVGEDMGPMRARLVREMEYIDCPRCLDILGPALRGL
jgi:hypothetical protein